MRDGIFDRTCNQSSNRVYDELPDQQAFTPDLKYLFAHYVFLILKFENINFSGRERLLLILKRALRIKIRNPESWLRYLLINSCN